MRWLIPPGREQTGDRQLDGIQRQAAESARVLNANPFATGMATELLTFFGGQTRTIEHKLQRIPTGFIVIYAQGAAPALSLDDPPNALTLIVTSDNAGVYRLWVF